MHFVALEIPPELDPEAGAARTRKSHPAAIPSTYLSIAGEVPDLSIAGIVCEDLHTFLGAEV